MLARANPESRSPKQLQNSVEDDKLLVQEYGYLGSLLVRYPILGEGSSRYSTQMAVA